ncbi:MAG: 4a-hydroxytetrahydrobiopterin dehydratase [Owenweeksia sp.]|nr:4a-hydroxytetrahydrobiopterin dehydratase [Owenweeksia sp.]
MPWKEENDKLVNEFEFQDFKEAFAFITKVALAAESAQHHPEVLNVYNKVKLSLSTHDDGGKVTQKDHKLADQIDRLL